MHGTVDINIPSKMSNELGFSERVLKDLELPIKTEVICKSKVSSNKNRLEERLRHIIVVALKRIIDWMGRVTISKTHVKRVELHNEKILFLFVFMLYKKLLFRAFCENYNCKTRNLEFVIWEEQEKANESFYYS